MKSTYLLLIIVIIGFLVVPALDIKCVESQVAHHEQAHQELRVRSKLFDKVVKSLLELRSDYLSSRRLRDRIVIRRISKHLLNLYPMQSYPEDIQSFAETIERENKSDITKEWEE